MMVDFEWLLFRDRCVNRTRTDLDSGGFIDQNVCKLGVKCPECKLSINGEPNEDNGNCHACRNTNYQYLDCTKESCIIFKKLKRS